MKWRGFRIESQSGLHCTNRYWSTMGRSSNHDCIRSTTSKNPNRVRVSCNGPDLTKWIRNTATRNPTHELTRTYTRIHTHIYAYIHTYILQRSPPASRRGFQKLACYLFPFISWKTAWLICFRMKRKQSCDTMRTGIPFSLGLLETNLICNMTTYFNYCSLYTILLVLQFWNWKVVKVSP